MVSRVLSQNWFEKIAKQEIDGSIAKRSPYLHLVFDDFLDAHYLAELKKYETKPDQFEFCAEFNFSHAPLLALDLVKVVYGKPFLSYLSALLSIELGKTCTRKLDQIPSFRIISGQSGGMELHNDENFSGHMVAFLYITEWKEGCGGEIELYDKKLQPYGKVAPIRNRFLMIPISEQTYHRVLPTNYPTNIDRECLFFPFTLHELEMNK